MLRACRVITPQELIEAFKLLLERVKFPNYGICSNVVAAVEELSGEEVNEELFLLNYESVDCFISTVSQHWPKYSGRYGYPVPMPDSLREEFYQEHQHSAQSAYQYLPKWLGEYGDLRRELLQFLIEELENGSYA